MGLSGCCDPNSLSLSYGSDDGNLPSNCRGFVRIDHDIADTEFRFCRTYQDYSTSGTHDTSDDVANGKLVVDNVQKRTPCAGSLLVQAPTPVSTNPPGGVCLGLIIASI